MKKDELKARVWKLVGTGKNEGKTALARVVDVHIYSARLQIFEVDGSKPLKRDSAGTQEIFFSTYQTAAATRGLTSWMLAPSERKQFAWN